MKNTSAFVLGCVADDFTGASDIASFMVEAGARCLLLDGTPKEACINLQEYDAVVIALKSRSIAAEEAVSQCMEAFDWLRSQGAGALYFKYCSTFDSTAQGNIGPVLDAALERYDLPYTILCPALPVNLRTVRDGNLYVNGIPLHESHMKNHPLNPMWDCSIPRLMEPQSHYPTFIYDHNLLCGNEESGASYIQELRSKHSRFYLAVDYFEESHGAMLAERFASLPLFSGGSALAGHLFRQLSGSAAAADRVDRVNGAPGSLVLAGSCSVATLGQIEDFCSRGACAMKILPSKLIGGEQTVEELWAFVQAHRDEDVLLYSSGDAGELAANRLLGQERVSAVLEQTMAALGRLAAENGMDKIVVAGGETSGAVTQALGCSAFTVGASVAPGVPLLYPVERPGLQLALKSGNFGQSDFFTRALALMRGAV